MNAWKPVVLGARSSVLTLVLVLGACAATVAGLNYWVGELQNTLTQVQRRYQEQQTQLSAKQEDLRNVREHIQRFETLRAQGLLGSPERTQWVEQLQTSYQELGLPGRIVYQLQAPVLLGAGAAPPIAGAPPIEGAPGTTPILSHDLTLELRDVHEGDVLTLLQNYRNQVKGRFRVNACALQDAKETGLKARCVLRFISVPIDPAQPVPQGGAPVPAG